MLVTYGKLPLVTFIQGTAVDDTEYFSCSVTSGMSVVMVELLMTSSGTVGVLVAVVSLSSVTGIIDIFTGFLVDWDILGYI
jgi:hypothetical protein